MSLFIPKGVDRTPAASSEVSYMEVSYRSGVHMWNVRCNRLGLGGSSVGIGIALTRSLYPDGCICSAFPHPKVPSGERWEFHLGCPGTLERSDVPGWGWEKNHLCGFAPSPALLLGDPPGNG